MKAQRSGAVIAAIGAVYLVGIAWTSSWWMVPALAAAKTFSGTAFSILWACSGVLGAIIVTLGAALYAGTARWLLFAAGGAVLLAWLILWPVSGSGALFGIGGGLILLFFLAFCWAWAGTRGAARTVADLRLAANLSFFIAAWGLCGLLGAPIFLLQRHAGDGSNLAVKVLVCLVLGFGFTAAAQWAERRDVKR